MVSCLSARATCVRDWPLGRDSTLRGERFIDGVAGREMMGNQSDRVNHVTVARLFTPGLALCSSPADPRLKIGLHPLYSAQRPHGLSPSVTVRDLSGHDTTTEDVKRDRLA
ncbi:hypothetical protein ElyMa_006035400 [Elysia marginata]|uniref:Uncharacterized protein n=1 Tax=Elysia marginata TaxID=1093978 RepID=A0AAV4GM72_9GAST|nr:hypothetical protein ElyMa_006035400 [Elysia marginata]